MIKEIRNILPEINEAIMLFEKIHGAHCTCDVSIAYDRMLVSVFNYMLEFKLEIKRRKDANPNPTFSKILTETADILEVLKPEQEILRLQFNEFVQLVNECLEQE